MFIPLYYVLVAAPSESGDGHEDRESKDLQMDYFYENESEAAAMPSTSVLRSGRRPRSATTLPVAPDVEDSSSVSALIRPSSADRI